MPTSAPGLDAPATKARRDVIKANTAGTADNPSPEQVLAAAAAVAKKRGLAAKARSTFYLRAVANLPERERNAAVVARLRQDVAEALPALRRERERIQRRLDRLARPARRRRRQLGPGQVNQAALSLASPRAKRRQTSTCAAGPRRRSTSNRRPGDPPDGEHPGGCSPARHRFRASLRSGGAR